MPREQSCQSRQLLCQLLRPLQQYQEPLELAATINLTLRNRVCLLI